MLLSQFVDNYLEELPTGIILTEEQITRNLLKAVRLYAGYAIITSLEVGEDGTHSDMPAGNDLSECDIDLNPSELAIIRPLFDLYIELENAMGLESARGDGLDVFGRSTGEIQQDINQKELEMHRIAFCEEFFTV